ncbi:MAG: DUF502 domain-containing protein [bacterium]|nr:DUF502 domain-containing protein [bacterium]
MNIKKNIFAGLMALFPIGLTAFVIWFVVNNFGGIFKIIFQKIPIFSSLPPFVHSLLGFITLVILIYIIGLITRNFIGKKLLQTAEKVITKIPVIQSIYNAGRKLTDGVFVDKSAFKSVVFVEFPRKGMYAIGFKTSKENFQIGDSPDNVSVYVPIPNGFYLAANKSDLIETSLSVDTALQIIISGGIISPTGQTAKEKPPENTSPKP